MSTLYLFLCSYVYIFEGLTAELTIPSQFYSEES